MIFLLFFLYSYIPIWNIVDARWELQLHRPLHAAAYYLNPHYHYNPNFKVNANIKIGLYQCLEKMMPNASERCKIDLQLKSFKNVKGLFGIEAADTTKRLMSSPKCRSVEIINNPTRPGSNHREVNCINYKQQQQQQQQQQQ
jgi:hypothetical protein